ncbi:MAG: imidazoleglycerol-phosphate dehydratase [Deltaproteobacteria bacterium]|nr:imidazoleglycerol-phosphate dehydratase [Deltaproteobacteria bacterium]
MNATTADRSGQCHRATKETKIDVTLQIDGKREISVQTGIGMLDHLLSALAFFASWDLTVRAEGDLVVDDHHTVEDTALCVGAAFDQALGTRQGICRFAHAYAPLDEALARVVVDLGTRSHASANLALKRERLGQLSCENIPHFLASLASAGRFCLHADVLRGENDHHRAEATFKALGLALRAGCRVDDARSTLSTKGQL